MTASPVTRPLGARSGIDVSALRFGCWAIDGPPGQSSGWGEIDDRLERDSSVHAGHSP